MTEDATAVLGDAVRLVADALGFELDSVRCDAEYAQTTEDLDLGSWRIAAGCVAGVAVSWQGVHDGRTVVALNARWRKGSHLETRLEGRARLHRRHPGASRACGPSSRSIRRPTSRRRRSTTTWCSG